MKNKYTLLQVLLVFMIPAWSLFAQGIPNPGFENWNGTTLTDWVHNGSSFIPTVTQSTDAYSGNFAVHGEVVDFVGTPFPPTLFPGTQASPLFAFTSRPNTLTGQYKFEGQGGDALFIEVVFINQSIGGGGEGHAEITANAAGYTLFEIPITYAADNPPGWQPTDASITITIKPPDQQIPSVGTKFTIDHLTFDGMPLDVEEIENGLKPDEYSLEQNYPNPFNPSTKIEFSVPESGNVSLQIYNLLGERVANLVNGYLNSGTYSAEWNAEALASGTYIYQINSGNYSETKKMILLK